MAREAVGGGRSRRCGSGSGRTWMEVHGLRSESGHEIGEQVQKVLRDTPGVERVELHRPWVRLVVTTEPDGPTPEEMTGIVESVERQFGIAGPDTLPVDLPGDDGLLARRVISVGAAATGLGVSLVGGILRMPRITGVIPAPVVAVDYQPKLRRIVESAVGTDGAEVLFSVLTAAAYTAAQVPSSLAVETAMRVAAMAETLAARRTWQEMEPIFAEEAADADGPPGPYRPRSQWTGPIERHAERSGIVGAAAAAVLGGLYGNPLSAGNAAIVAAPKATRTTRELFAATLGRGLPTHGVLPIAATALRHLDRVDAVVIDPRVLYTAKLDVTRVLGVNDHDRTRVWECARRAVEKDEIDPGWHPVQSIPGVHGIRDGRVLVGPVHDGYASALLAEARRARVEVISADDDSLRSLRNGFDRLQPFSESMDRTLRDAVEECRQDGRTVAVVAAEAPNALAAADVGIGVVTAPAARPWGAHLICDDLTGVWRVLHALPPARSASRRGVQLSLSATALGALLMLPGVAGQGPESVTASAAVGLWVGYSTARNVFAERMPDPRPEREWHAMPVEEVIRSLPRPHDVSPRDTSATAPALLRRVPARAVVPAVAAYDFARALRGELADPLTPVLATCAAASAVLGSPVDALLVGSVLALNAAISASQRLRAERALKSLLVQQDPIARLRQGSETRVRYIETASGRVRPGDVIEVRPGEVVPADGRIAVAAGVEVDESSLTGESLPVTKYPGPTPGAPLAERTCMIYAGTTVLTGTAVAHVTAVGGATETRRATAMAPTAIHDVGLQSQLRALTRRALPVSFGGGVLVGILGMLRGAGLRAAVVSGVSVVVAAVPEGMPLVATLAQTASARRLTTSSALVRTPRAIEALGRVDVVCFDKTGTLSENRLRVRTARPAPGYTRAQLLSFAARTGVSDNGGPPDHATDAAIVGAARADSLDDCGSTRTAYLPFRSGRSYAAALNGRHLTVKGAPEVMSAAYSGDHHSLLAQVDTMAEAGLRVIAVGERILTDEEADAVAADPGELEALCESTLRPVGLIGLSDTPRPEALGLLPALRGQGIGVRLITGDHPVTAVAIADELGLKVTADQVIDGTEWDSLSLEEQEHAVRERLVFARMTPEHKVQIVQTIERSGQVCAMVGDGANDAAAIRAASVGVGVASRGSDPARGAADVVLLDGKVGALLDALDEGRQLWQRVTAAVAVLLGGNAGEVMFAIIGSMFTGQSPLNARQLLLVNMLTDALPAAALAVGSTNGRTSGADTTRGPDQAALLKVVAVRGVTTAAGASLAWAVASMTGTRRRASTVALIALVCSQLGQTLLDSRSPLVVATALGSLAVLALIISIPVVSIALGCVPVGPVGWAVGLGSAAAATAAAAVAPTVLRRMPALA
ncbi:cation-translocating P-type ATPase [Rhodococcus artemisiae]|nr:cation-translocating P-type ATPase [Rhodococcus artemisiae]